MGSPCNVVFAADLTNLYVARRLTTATETTTDC
ncbi:hypothetical protein Thi970DRAFT_00527 [Thiorhodovibrio frisius]|uniref:Uncharacterized protein n=1 Tax=Thiorhodovibrio frisius TaxID=631362 RepID=H8YWR2_9GAMM|nr:hypothetical protein Thi970DRAFT_00527 [Thiorhodovibrio frisius]WPL22854.1 hypothetical protein Thiofri_03029 [Thiorhodovibrio frisius]